MRKIKKKKIKNELNEVSIEKESIIKRIFNFFKTKLTDTSKVKISVKGLSNATLIPILIKNMK